MLYLPAVMTPRRRTAFSTICLHVVLLDLLAPKYHFPNLGGGRGGGTPISAFQDFLHDRRTGGTNVSAPSLVSRQLSHPRNFFNPHMAFGDL